MALSREVAIPLQIRLSRIQFVLYEDMQRPSSRASRIFISSISLTGTSSPKTLLSQRELCSTHTDNTHPLNFGHTALALMPVQHKLIL
jgi:hypothetical protein